jgi:hypothetical protein
MQIDTLPLSAPALEQMAAEAWEEAKRRKQLAGGRYRTFQTAYRDDPVAFIHDCIRWPKGEKPAPYQDAIASSLIEHVRVAVRGPHGLGKTAEAAWLVLWFALTRDGEDWKVPTTASGWRHLSRYLWPEIHKWARLLDWTKIGRPPFDERHELLTLTLRLSSGEAFAVASDVPALIEGAHAEHLLYLFDEAKEIPNATWDASEGAFSSGIEAKALAISTPGEPIGRFYDIHSRKPGYEDWHAIHVKLEDAIKAGRISPKWAEQRKRQWGESSVYQNRVLGEFAARDEDGIIPLAWVEAANERWQKWVEMGKPGVPVSLGVDVARSGGDKTAMALQYEVAEMDDRPCKRAIDDLRFSVREDTMATTGRAAGILSKYPIRASVDVIGIGAGVVDRLREQGFSVDGFNASEGIDRKDKTGELGFTNMRSAAWWNLREMLDPSANEEVALPPDDELTGDLTAPRWKLMSGGRIQVESKDEIRKRLGRSTDAGDAVIMAMERGISWLLT